MVLGTRRRGGSRHCGDGGGPRLRRRVQGVLVVLEGSYMYDVMTRPSMQGVTLKMKLLLSMAETGDQVFFSRAKFQKSHRKTDISSLSKKHNYRTKKDQFEFRLQKQGYIEYTCCQYSSLLRLVQCQ
jgi:hypothetical protein